MSPHKVLQPLVLDLALVLELNVATLHSFDKFTELFLHFSYQFLVMINNLLQLRPIYLIFMGKLTYLAVATTFLLFLFVQSKL